MGLQVHMTMLEDLKRAAWGRTSPVSGQLNAWEFRKDCLGKVVRYSDFGNRHSPFGWELDHIVPRSVGAASVWPADDGSPLSSASKRCRCSW